MYQGKTLTQLAAEIERQAKAKIDIVADTRTLALTDDLTLQAPGNSGLPPTLPVSDYAHRQIGARLNIPAAYYDRMRSDAPSLLARNVNHWFNEKPERRMVRTLDGRMRSFQSDRYQRIDNLPVAETVLPILLGTPGLSIASCEITERRLYIKAVTAKVQGEVKVGEVVQAGVIISNSEIGAGAATVGPFAEVLACKNGMVISDGRFGKYHVGGRIDTGEALYKVLSDETLKADDRAILLKMRDAVRAAFNAEIFAEHIGKMRAAAEDRPATNAVKAVEMLSNQLALGEGESQSVLTHLIQGGDLTRWGFLNAVTRTAQDAPNYDRATELEAMGGKMLDLTRAEWQTVAEAA